MNFFDKVNYVCRCIPEGKAASYGQIAILIGSPRAARQVGTALNRGCFGAPAHRVVNRRGELSGAAAFSMKDEQANLLRMEGVEVKNERIDLDKYEWKPNQTEIEEIYAALNK